VIKRKILIAEFSLLTFLLCWVNQKNHTQIENLRITNTFTTVKIYTITFYTIVFIQLQNLYGPFLYGHILYGPKYKRLKIYTVPNLYVKIYTL
jgi:hypothetical protein